MRRRRSLRHIGGAWVIEGKEGGGREGVWAQRGLGLCVCVCVCVCVGRQGVGWLNAWFWRQGVPTSLRLF